MHPNAAFDAPAAEGWALVERVGSATVACAGPALGSDAVLTWYHLAAEFEGAVTPLSEAEPREHLERKALAWEPEVPRCTLATADPRRVDSMMPAIGGRLTVDAMRVAAKLGQNKPAADREGVANGLRRMGNTALAERMEAW